MPKRNILFLSMQWLHHIARAGCGSMLQHLPNKHSEALNRKSCECFPSPQAFVDSTTTLLSCAFCVSHTQSRAFRHGLLDCPASGLKLPPSDTPYIQHTQWSFCFLWQFLPISFMNQERAVSAWHQDKKVGYPQNI